MYGQFLALFASFMWASSSILYKKALVKFSPSILNTIRPLTALLFLSVVLIYEEEFLNLFSHSQKTYLLTFLTAIFGLLLGDFFYLSSIKLIGVSRALPLASITPLIVALISHFYLKEIITLNLIVGTFLILLGIYLITEENKKQEKMKKGILFAFLAALFWALYVVISKVALEEIRPIAFNIIRMFFFSSIMV
ncbi:MAG: DMT family transporter, partial [Candidatus Methanofastidiosia archaeon]